MISKKSKGNMHIVELNNIKYYFSYDTLVALELEDVFLFSSLTEDYSKSTMRHITEVKNLNITGKKIRKIKKLEEVNMKKLCDMTLSQKVEEFKKLVEFDIISDLYNKKLSCNNNLKDVKLEIIETDKYFKIISKTTSYFIIDRNGNIYGMGAYGRINKSRNYGGINHIYNFYWGIKNKKHDRQAYHKSVLSGGLMKRYMRLKTYDNECTIVDLKYYTKVAYDRAAELLKIIEDFQKDVLSFGYNFFGVEFLDEI